MKELNEIIYGVEILDQKGDLKRKVSSVEFDSRKVKHESCFVAQKGTQVDGHQFIQKAIQDGAVAIICESFPEETAESVCYVKVKDSSKALGYMASNFYDEPSKKLKLIGVTGTNGKTTTVTLLHHLYQSLGFKAGLISTVENKVADQIKEATHTTPDAIQLNALLFEMVEQGCSHCFMEVSSHSVVQQRIAGLYFEGAVFTNITHEHLDFHKTFENYIEAKRLFFNQLTQDGFALSNNDDRNGKVMLQETKAKKYYYALKSQADYRAKLIDSNFEGIHLKIDNQDFMSPLIGSFNAYNLLAVYATACLLGEDRLDVLTALSNLKSVAGRFQHIQIGGVIGIVDYAHSPDALENVLATIKNIRKGNEDVITVVGCGGDRDKGKRPLMASIACQWSDRVILTSDNPRSEDPEQIINEMKEGVDAASKRKVLSIINRKEAIRTASSLAEAGDILLVAGKGHETYQEVKGERMYFDDMEVLNEALSQHIKTVK